MKCPNCGLALNEPFSTCPRCAYEVLKGKKNNASKKTVSKSSSPNDNIAQEPKRQNNNQIVSVCTNPNCGLTINGTVSECPKCLRVMSQKNQNKAPEDTVPQSLSPQGSTLDAFNSQVVNENPVVFVSPTPPFQPTWREKIQQLQIQPVPWDDRLSTAQNFYRDIQQVTTAINKLFDNIKQDKEGLKQKDKQDDVEISSVQNNIQIQYANKISKLKAENISVQNNIQTQYTNKLSEIKAKNFSVQRDIQKKYEGKLSEIKAKNVSIQDDIKKKCNDKLADIINEQEKATSKAVAINDIIRKPLDADLRKLTELDNQLPFDIAKNYIKKNSYPPIKPDFQNLSILLEETKKKGIPSYLTQLLLLLPIIGWIILIVLITNRNHARDRFMDEIRSAKAYIDPLIQPIRDELNKERSRIDKYYDDSKAVIYKDYNIAKTDADRDFNEAKAVIDKDYNAEIADADRDFNKNKAVIDKDYNTAKADADKDYNAAKADTDRKQSNYLRTIEQERESRAEILKKEKYNIDNIDSISDEICKNTGLLHLESGLKSALEKLGGVEDVWKGEFQAMQKYPKEIMFGFIEFPVTLPETIVNRLKTKMPSVFSMGKGIAVPFTELMNNPIQLIIDYDNDRKTDVMTGVQSFIMKLLKYMPLFSFTVTYIDPNDRGSNLGPLIKLAGITYFDVCKKVYASREDIQKRLKELETFVDKTTATLAGTDSVYSYNAQSNSRIENHFIIINDYPENFERNSTESLKVIIKNAYKCGISIIFTTNNETSDLPDDAVQKFRTIEVHKSGEVIAYDGASYPFRFDKLTANCESFLEKYKNICNEGIKVDNYFKTYFHFSKSDPVHFEDSTDKMIIPFAVDSYGNLIELELGSPLTAHALLSGTTGSGKSTTLHMLITSIIMKYHPDDVQLWLVDYKKVEFAEYIETMPPHVKLIGLERSKEFTYSLLDMVDTIFQRRAELFKQAGVRDISEYRKNGGKIPRIILIIDEFHEMTQAIQSEPHYSQILENILSEYRAFGLSCVFSDQAISVGLRGLSDKGKMQIRTRIAMSNDLMEIRETLALDSSFYDENMKNKMLRMSVGDVIFKRMSEDDAGEAQIILEKYRTVLVTKPERISVIEWITKNTGVPKEKPLVVDGQHRSSFNQEIIDNFERENSLTGEQIPLYIGTPASLNPCFCFSLREKKRDSNIMVIGANDDLRASVAYWSIYSFMRQNDYQVYVFADNNDELFSQYKDKFLSLSGKNCLVSTDLSEICNVISDLRNCLKPGNTRTFVVWLGLDNIAEELLSLPEKPASGGHKNTPDTSNRASFAGADDLEATVEAMLEKAFGNTSVSEIIQGGSTPKAENAKADTPEPSRETAYNATPDIQEIIEKGSRYGIFTLVTYSSYKSLRDTKCVKADNFEHKIAFKMTTDESSNYLGRSSHASGLDAITAVYYDGISIKTLRPYLI